MIGRVLLEILNLISNGAIIVPFERVKASLSLYLARAGNAKHVAHG